MPPRRCLALVLLLAAGCSTSPTDPADRAPRAASPAGRRVDAKGQDNPGARINALLGCALDASRQDRFDEAIGKLDQALAIEPGHRRARILKAAILDNQAGLKFRGDSRAAGALVHEAAALVHGLNGTIEPLDPYERDLVVRIFYQEARARAGQATEALAALKEAAAAGLDEPGVFESEDFRALRDRPEFPALRDQVERQADQRAATRARALLAGFRPFPFHVKLPDLDGNPVKLADRLGRVTIVDLWGTWCLPCRMEIPHLVALYERDRGRGLAVVGVNFENSPPELVKDQVKQFVADRRIPYPCLFGDDSTLALVPDFRGYPTALFLDRTGTVRAMLVGYHPRRDLEALVAALLAEPADRAGPDE